MANCICIRCKCPVDCGDLLCPRCELDTECTDGVHCEEEEEKRAIPTQPRLPFIYQ